MANELLAPNILVVGPTGTGKSSILRNLNPETTSIINAESKALPFRQASKFKRTTVPKNMRDVYEILNQLLKTEKETKVVILDSIVPVLEFILKDCKKSFSGWDVWNAYNERVLEFVTKCREFSMKGIVLVILDHDLIIQNSEMDNERVAYVEGTKWKGKIEKEFTIVLHTRVKKKEEGMEYVFVTNNDGERCAKSPMEMFKDINIPNDLNLVIEAINNYYGEEIEDN